MAAVRPACAGFTLSPLCRLFALAHWLGTCVVAPLRRLPRLGSSAGFILLTGSFVLAPSGSFSCVGSFAVGVCVPCGSSRVLALLSWPLELAPYDGNLSWSLSGDFLAVASLAFSFVATPLRWLVVKEAISQVVPLPLTDKPLPKGLNGSS